MFKGNTASPFSPPASRLTNDQNGGSHIFMIYRFLRNCYLFSGQPTSNKGDTLSCPMSWGV